MVPKPALPAHSCHPSLACFASITSLASFTPSPEAIQRFLIPLLILAGIVIASAAQTEVAHHITADLDYNQPYFTFLLTHITFSLVFPLHLAVLYLFRKQTIATYLDGIRHVIAAQVGGHGHSGWKEIGLKWSMKVGWLTLLISVPALSWFVAMVFTSAMDVTAIYATSSFHAYFFSMILLKTPLSRKTVASIVLAFAGVIVISFAGSGGATEDRSGPRNRALGDTVMMFGAVILGLYEVVYKMALPERHGGISSESAAPSADYAALPMHADAFDPTMTPPESRASSPPIDDRPRGPYTKPRGPEDIPLSPHKPVHDRLPSSTPLLRVRNPPSPPLSDTSLRNDLSSPEKTDYPPLPVALHANFLTSCIGIATLIMLWVPIVILDLLGWEAFRIPSFSICRGLAVVSWAGALYNAGLMVLIGIWGPTTSSVANLLTIGLVAIIDAVWLGNVPDLQTLIGVGMICVGFGVLLWEGEG